MKHGGEEIPDGAIFAVCAMFLDGEKVTAIRKKLNEAYGWALHRQQIYSLVAEGVTRGFLQLTAPLEETIRRMLSEKFAEFNQMPADTRVVNALQPHALDATAQIGASVVYELVIAKVKAGAPLSIGFGAGETIRRVSNRLARMLESVPEIPELTLVALTQSFTPQSPESSPTTFLHAFDQLAKRTTVRSVGLFAEPMVEAANYEGLRQHPVVGQSFKAARNIDIVVTSCATATDDHSLLQAFMKLGGKATRQDLTTLKRCGWVGDVLWRPYSEKGPITRQTRYRAVTLFEIEDLRSIAEVKDKHTVVIAGPCARCGKPKTAALRPLLMEPTLGICNHLVMDILTAEELLKS